MWSNNRGDSDYFEYCTGLRTSIVPSLCDYINIQNTRTGKIKLYLCKSTEISDYIDRSTDGWERPDNVFGTSYPFKALEEVSSIFVIPYQISTMRLFELATLGIPVIIPSTRLLEELKVIDSDFLHELSYIKRSVINELDEEEINPNLLTPQNISWWLYRADFYNAELMPNITIIDKLSELDSVNRDSKRRQIYDNVIKRNNELFKNRKNALEIFLDSVLLAKNTS
jgi:hypothetical protein